MNVLLITKNQNIYIIYIAPENTNYHLTLVSKPRIELRLNSSWLHLFPIYVVKFTTYIGSRCNQLPRWNCHAVNIHTAQHMTQHCPSSSIQLSATDRLIDGTLAPKARRVVLRQSMLTINSSPHIANYYMFVFYFITLLLLRYCCHI